MQGTRRSLGIAPRDAAHLHRMSMHPNRVHSGVPTGGQYTTAPLSEAGLSLSPEPPERISPAGVAALTDHQKSVVAQLGTPWNLTGVRRYSGRDAYTFVSEHSGESFEVLVSGSRAMIGTGPRAAQTEVRHGKDRAASEQASAIRRLLAARVESEKMRDYKRAVFGDVDLSNATFDMALDDGGWSIHIEGYGRDTSMEILSMYTNVGPRPIAMMMVDFEVFDVTGAPDGSLAFWEESRPEATPEVLARIESSWAAESGQDVSFGQILSRRLS